MLADNILGASAWVIGPYLKLIGEYRNRWSNTQSQSGQSDGIRQVIAVGIV